MDIHDIILASRAEQSYSTRARWALRAIRKYLRLGLAPSWRYKILHAHARAIFSTALKAAVISIYIYISFAVFPERRVKVEAVVSVKW